MTRGTDVEALKEVVKEISGTVYAFMSGAP
jgi:hypothetical protein